MEPDDETLAKAAQGGDAAAFETLVTRHYDLIYRLGFRILGTRDAAQDLAQDICAALPAKLRGFRGKARFTTWLFRIVSNAAIDRIRRRQSRDKALDGWGEITQLARADDAQKQQETAWLHQAMNRLTPELRQTVALVLSEEMTHAEAARVLDLSEGTISWRMSEVKKMLRQMAREEAVE